MISLIEEENDGTWGSSVKRFLTVDPIAGWLNMMLPHGIIISAPISSLDMRGDEHIRTVRKPIYPPRTTFYTSMHVTISPGNIKPLRFRKRYPVTSHLSEQDI